MRNQIGQTLKAFRKAFTARGEANTEMRGHCKAVARGQEHAAARGFLAEGA